MAYNKTRKSYFGHLTKTHLLRDEETGSPKMRTGFQVLGLAMLTDATIRMSVCRMHPSITPC